MSFDLIPKSFSGISRWQNLWDEDDWASILPSSSGLTVSEGDSQITVEAAVPGLSPQDIEVTFDKGVLWIRGSQKQEEKDEQKKYYRKAASSFSYRVAVPGDIDETKEPEVTCKNGILKAVFNKRPEVHPKKLTIKSE